MDDPAARPPAAPSFPVNWVRLPGITVQWAPGSAEGGGAASPLPVALAIGIFDGVHRGHQAVLASARRAAESASGRVLVLTFEPHPTRILRPEAPTRLLYDHDMKAARLFAHGVAAIIWKRFDAAFAARSAEDFVAALDEGFPTLHSVHVGENFRFGQRRAGTPEVIRAGLAGRGVAVDAVPGLLYNGAPVSSTRLRAALAEGRLAEANAMLGAPYACRAPLVPGRQLGRSIGFPTFNLAYDPESRPAFGVYAVRTTGPGGTTRPAVANFGLRPTVEEAAPAPLLEVHLLDSASPPAWHPGDTLTVEWLAFLRPEQRFPNLDALKTQITQDVAAATTLLEKGSNQ
ncbi:MAG: riboflavin biosynthesis protein RibF [Opitutales bacterium]